MKYLIAFNNTRLQTVHFLEEIVKLELASTTQVTLYDPVKLKEAEEGLRSVKFFHSSKELPWTYRQDKAVFEEEHDYIIFNGTFESIDLTKIGSMMRDFTRNLKIYKDVKEICFLGNIRGLLQASIFYRKFQELGEKIRCYSAEHFVGDQIKLTVYPEPDEKFLGFKDGERDPGGEKEVEEFAKMFVSSHATKMWIHFISETMEGEDSSAKFYGRVVSEGEARRLEIGNKYIIFLPAVEDTEMPEEMNAAAYETYKKIQELVKKA